jgi:GNAT superfamily N-acetyltransferase
VSFTIQELPYSPVEAFWAAHLWPGKPESLRPMSSMLFHGGFNRDIRDRYEPVFFGAFSGSELVGVNSGHFTAPGEFRSRGLCVLPPYRGKGLGLLLLRRTLEHARGQGARLVWSYPKEKAWKVYERAGYRQTDRVLRDGDENRYAYVELATSGS